MSRVKKLGILAVTVLIVAAFASYFWWHASRTPSFSGVIRKAVVCADKKEPIPCIRPFVQELLTTHRASEIVDAFAAAGLSQSTCHFFSHVVGQETYLKYRNTERALAECSSTCGVGCVHGAVGQAFETDAGLDASQIDLEHLSIAEIKTIGSRLCNTIHMCHGVGHALFLNTQSFDPALSMCETVATSTKRVSCMRGVFMEYALQISNRSIWDRESRLTAPLVEKLSTFCNFSDDGRQYACYAYFPFILASTHAAQGDIIDRKQTAQYTWRVCKEKTGTDRQECVFGIGLYLYGDAFVNQEAMKQTCSWLPEVSDRVACALGAITLGANFNSVDTLLSFCSAQPDIEVRASCYRRAYRIYAATPELKITPMEAMLHCPQADKVMCIEAERSLEISTQEELQKFLSTQGS